MLVCHCRDEVRLPITIVPLLCDRKLFTCFFWCCYGYSPLPVSCGPCCSTTHYDTQGDPSLHLPVHGGSHTYLNSYSFLLTLSCPLYQERGLCYSFIVLMAVCGWFVVLLGVSYQLTGSWDFMRAMYHIMWVLVSCNWQCTLKPGSQFFPCVMSRPKST